ncbi:hypothetical protein H7U20_03585, partial [Rugamonas sp. CCM 8940]|nr:hypothetical protein [Rugamonas sp. CCM 8940]
VLARERQQRLERLRHLFRHHAGAGGGVDADADNGGGAELLRLLTDYRLRERP